MLYYILLMILTYFASKYLDNYEMTFMLWFLLVNCIHIIKINFGPRFQEESYYSKRKKYSKFYLQNAGLLQSGAQKPKPLMSSVISSYFWNQNTTVVLLWISHSDSPNIYSRIL